MAARLAFLRLTLGRIHGRPPLLIFLCPPRRGLCRLTETGGVHVNANRTSFAHTDGRSESPRCAQTDVYSFFPSTARFFIVFFLLRLSLERIGQETEGNRVAAGASERKVDSARCPPEKEKPCRQLSKEYPARRTEETFARTIKFPL